MLQQETSQILFYKHAAYSVAHSLTFARCTALGPRVLSIRVAGITAHLEPSTAFGTATVDVGKAVKSTLGTRSVGGRPGHGCDSGIQTGSSTRSGIISRSGRSSRRCSRPYCTDV